MITQVVLVMREGKVHTQLAEGTREELEAELEGKILKIIPLGDLTSHPGMELAFQIDAAYRVADPVMLHLFDKLVEFVFQEGRKFEKQPEPDGEQIHDVEGGYPIEG